VTLEVGADSDQARRELGGVTWSVLEVLALMGTDVDGRWVAATNARDLAARLGIGKNRAAASLSALRQAGLVVTHATRDAATARFAPSRYEVQVPVSRCDDTLELEDNAARSPKTLSRTRGSAASSSKSLDLFSSVK
jgi:hypothetical protein